MTDKLQSFKICKACAAGDMKDAKRPKQRAPINDLSPHYITHLCRKSCQHGTINMAQWLYENQRKIYCLGTPNEQR